MTVTGTLAFFGDRPSSAPAAVTARGEVLTVAGVDARARALAAAAGDADALVCLADDRLNVAVSLLAALHAGVPCLMPHDHAAETVRRLRAAHPGAGFVADGEGFEAVSPLRLDLLAPSLPRSGVAAFPPARIAARVFTSGSTGQPTGHDKPWAAFAAVGANLGQRLPFRAGMRVVATVPGQHMYGLEASLMLPLRAGGLLQAARPLFPADIASALDSDAAPAALVTTPVHLRALLRSGQSVRPPAFVLSATAPLDARLAGQAESRLGAPVYEIFGCTEAGTVATRRTVDETVWQPCEGVSVGTNAQGQAEVTAPYLPAPVRLADHVRVNGDGGFTLHGREGDLINIAGKRGSLGDITARLLALPGVEDAVVHVPAETGGGEVHRLVAFVVAPGQRAERLREALRGVLDPAFVPRPLICVESLPRNAAGKLTRAGLDALQQRHLGEAGP